MPSSNSVVIKNGSTISDWYVTVLDLNNNRAIVLQQRLNAGESATTTIVADSDGHGQIEVDKQGGTNTLYDRLNDGDTVDIS
jgi:hypothetical protein